MIPDLNATQQPAVSHFSGSGLPLGSIVITTDGPLPVEFLYPGDQVAVKSGGWQPVIKINHHSTLCKCVQIAAGSIGNSAKDKDAILPEKQLVLVSDWRARALFQKSEVIVPFVDLIDGQFIAPVGERQLRLFELHFEVPQIIESQGLDIVIAYPEQGSSMIQ